MYSALSGASQGTYEIQVQSSSDGLKVPPACTFAISLAAVTGAGEALKGPRRSLACGHPDDTPAHLFDRMVSSVLRTLLGIDWMSTPQRRLTASYHVL